MNSFYSEKELNGLGFKSFGKNVMISRKASFYGIGDIEIGSNVRIDDFCILSGKITLGNYVHIAAYSGLFGGSNGIVFDDFSGVSSKVMVYAESDDYSGKTMTQPVVPEKYTGVYGGLVHLEKHVLVGTGCSILPNVTIGEGTAVGAMSLVNKPLEAWGIYVGIPCRRIAEREKKLLELEKQLHDEKNN